MYCIDSKVGLSRLRIRRFNIIYINKTKYETDVKQKYETHLFLNNET